MSLQQLYSEIELGSHMGIAALVLGLDNTTVLVDTDITAWTLEVFDVSQGSSSERRRPEYTITVDPLIVNTNASLPSAPVIWNTSATPRNDGYWDAGPEPGYNFLFFLTETDRMAALDAFVLKGAHRYRMVYKITTVSWGILTLTHNVYVKPS